MQAQNSIGILQELKQKTASHHQSLEQGSNILHRLGSAGSYRSLLLWLASIYSPLEGQISKLDDLPFWLPDFASRRRTPALLEDLAFLGDSFDLPPIDMPPIPSNLPSITGSASALGCLYVLQGSTLGGMIIAREVIQKLGFTPEKGCRFFSSYGPAVAAMWNSFGQATERFCQQNQSDRPLVIQGALATFHCLAQSLDSDCAASSESAKYSAALAQVSA